MALLDKAVAALRAERHVEALRLYRAAAAAAPRDATTLYQYGALLTQIGRAAEATPLLREARTLSGDAPTVRHALALTLLAAGNYAEAWPLFRRRYEVPELWQGKAPSVPFTRWQGEDIAGRKLMILPEAGIGDQIQFARFVPELARRGADVTLLSHPALTRLFAYSLPGITVLAAAGTVDLPDPDYWTQTSDLAGDLGLTIAEIAGTAYLTAGETITTPGAGLRIGLKVRGDPNFPRDAMRSLSDEDAANLRAKLPGTIVSLDPADSGAADFADTAAIVAGLDAVVAVDTSVAHLAGALGTLCFVLVPGFATDWRWGERVRTTPWYDGVRLYRSDLRGHWQTAIRELSQDVRATFLAKR